MSTSSIPFQPSDFQQADLRSAADARRSDTPVSSLAVGFASTLDEADREQTNRAAAVAQPDRPAARETTRQDQVRQDQRRQDDARSDTDRRVASRQEDRRQENRLQEHWRQETSRRDATRQDAADARSRSASASRGQDRDEERNGPAANAPSPGGTSGSTAARKAAKADAARDQSIQDQSSEDQSSAEASARDGASQDAAALDAGSRAGTAAGDPVQTALVQLAQALAGGTQADDATGAKADEDDTAADAASPAIDPALLAALTQIQPAVAAKAQSQAGAPVAEGGLGAIGAAGHMQGNATLQKAGIGKAFGDKASGDTSAVGSAAAGFAEAAGKAAEADAATAGVGTGQGAAETGKADARLPEGVAALAAALKGEGGVKDNQNTTAGDLAARVTDRLATDVLAGPDPAAAPGQATSAAQGSQAPLQTPARPDAAGASASAAVPVAALPIEIGMKALEGNQSFSIRLHPEELGKVDVKLHISDDGTVQAQIVVDRVETLAMLQRDARTLERSFEQAGLRTGDNGLQFSLSSDNGQQRGQQQNGNAPRQPAQAAGFNALSGQDLASALSAIRAAAGGLDIRI